MSQRPTFVVTTPIYYVNASPHIGSAYTTMAADAIARYHRLRGDQVLMVTGTDEHGQKIQRTAEERGIDPQQHCDQIASEFQRLWGLLKIRYDRFIRTTDPRHVAIAKEFFQRVWDQGERFTIVEAQSVLQIAPYLTTWPLRMVERLEAITGL